MLVAGLGAGVAYAVESGDSTADVTEQTQVASGQETSESQDASEDSVAEGAEDEADGTADTADAQNAGQDDAIGDDAKTDDGSTDKVDTGVNVADTEDAADGSDAGISTLVVDDPDHTVQGVSPRGTTINVFDYWIHERDDEDDRDWETRYYYEADNNAGINNNHALKFSKGAEKQQSVAAFNQWTGTAKPYQQIVDSHLGEDGYPKLDQQVTGSSESLSYLFDTQDGAYKMAFPDVDGLLQVDGQGYYYYSSGESTGESNGNFAQFNEDTKDFTLYNTWGVRKGGQSPNGQFFPFNTGEEVFQGTGLGGITQNGITSTSSVINHYFGLSMSTRFVQPKGGVIEGTQTPMTYNFSGDDDVWVYIDGVLVGDLGGIHNKTSLEINFQDGHVCVYKDSNNNNRWDQNEEWYKRTTLAKIMDDAGVTTGLSDSTFVDGTYHTLDFFYLERGNTDSNMSLKYNLVVPPETDIVKIDQDGEGVNGAVFEVYVADEGYNKIQGDAACTATTGADGSVVLLDAQGMPITFDQLWTQYSNSHSAPNDDSTGGGKRINLVLSETKVPAGYRSTGDIHMYLWHKNSGDVQGQDDVNLLLADMSTGDQSGGVTGTTWQTGAYAQPTVQVTAPNRLIWEGGSVETDKMQEDNGRLFAIVEKNVNGTWVPVYGSQQNGWTVAKNNDMAAVQAADDATQASFMLASSGSFQALIDGLPGRIQNYVFFHTNGGGEYRGVYFYTTAGTGGMTAANTHRVTNTSEFGRQFAAHLYVPNIINRVIVQKTDDDGNPVNGAEFTMYYSNTNGTPDYEKMVGTVTTKTLTQEEDKIDLDGAAVFAGLNTGTYWIKETKAPAGYETNETPAKVIVTADGVYADAGKADDGVKVTRGVGRIVRSMLQFAVDDDIDATLNQIIATPQTGAVKDNGTVGEWTDVPGAKSLHLKYGGKETVLDYGVQYPTEEKDRRFTVDKGIPHLKVQQCNEVTEANTDNIHVTDPRVFKLGDTDISGLFTGVTIVQVTDQRLGSLKISKTVTGDDVPQDAMFTFDITLKDGESEPVSGTFTAGVYNATNQPVADSISNIEFTNGKATVTLQSSQYVVIEGLSVGTTYTVTERAAPGYTPSYTVNNVASPNGSTATGSIAGLDTNPGQIGQQVSVPGWTPNQTVAFTNKYTPSVTASFTIAKQIEGRGWLPDDTFSFLVGMSKGNVDAVTMPTDDNGAVLGTEKNPVVIKNGTSGHKTAYGDITFTEPGEYEFTVTEVHGNADGMTYSGAKFTVTVDMKNLTSDPTVTVARTNGTDVDGKVNDGTDTVTFINHFGRVSSIPLTGGDSTARSLLLAGGGVLLVAGAAWLLSRRRRV